MYTITLREFALYETGMLLMGALLTISLIAAWNGLKKGKDTIKKLRESNE